MKSRLGNKGANKGARWQCKPKQQTIEYMVRCTWCRELFMGFRTKGAHTCPKCKKIRTRNAIRRKEETTLNWKENEILRRPWHKTVGRVAVRKKWILCFGIEKLVCTQCGYKENWRLIWLHHDPFFETLGKHDPEFLTPLCVLCHDKLHREKGWDSGGY
jgi:phage FluMu protein Com